MSIPNTFPQRTTAVKLIESVQNDGTAITSTIIDRLGFQSGKLVLNWAASSGTPTTAAASLIFYSNSASSSSSPTPVALVTLETALDVKTAGFAQYDIDFSNAKRYVYAVLDITYADGTSPKNILSASLVLGDKNVQPANSGTVYGR
jgi:hypothetical protein